MMQREVVPLEVESKPAVELEIESQRIRKSFAMVPSLVAQYEGRSLTFVIANDAYLQLVDRSREEVLGKRFADVFPELEEQGYGEAMRRVIDTGEIFIARECERRLQRQGRTESVYIDFIYLPIRNAAGAVCGVMFQGMDVTEEVQSRLVLEERVRARTSELERAQAMLEALNMKVFSMQEQEQRRLALELHDSAGQLLTSLRWKLGSLQREIGRNQPELAKLAKSSVELVNELSSELRTISHLLFPPTLNEGELPLALRRFVDGFAERSGLQVDLQVQASLAKIPAQVERTLFRIVQESLTNIHRHAKSKIARVRLTQSHDQILLRIRDCGHGIPGFKSIQEPNFKAGVGIQGMRERVQQLNGTFQILSSTSGTTVRVGLPRALQPIKITDIGRAPQEASPKAMSFSALLQR